MSFPNFAVERVQRMVNFAADNYSVNRECEWIIGHAAEPLRERLAVRSRFGNCYPSQRGSTTSCT